MALLGVLVKLALGYQATITVSQNIERHTNWRQARNYADAVGKPLLVVGMKRWPWQPADGDVTLDTDPAVENLPGGVIADARDIPFDNKVFGAAYVPHVLEHLPSAADVEMAVNECLRVADKVFLLTPSPWDPVSNMFNPGHHLRLWFDQKNNRIKVTDNRWRTGAGFNTGPDNIGQAMVVEDTMPEIVRIGNAYVIGGTT